MEQLHSNIRIENAETAFYIFFIYIIKLAEDISLVPHIVSLINDTSLVREFSYQPSSIAESFVIHLYNEKLDKEPEYGKNEDYLREIISILPEESEIKQFILYQFEIATMLSGYDKKVIHNN